MNVTGGSTVITVARDGVHRFSKTVVPSIALVAGRGVVGDAHSGVTVQHRSRVAKDPSQPNLRQVHLIHGELLDELAGKGFTVAPGDMGENILTTGVDLLGLPRGTRLAIGTEAVLTITGLRNPCVQIDRFQAGLMHAVLDTDMDGGLIRRAGIMAVVTSGGNVAAGDPIRVTLPPTPWKALQPV